MKEAEEDEVRFIATLNENTVSVNFYMKERNREKI